MGTENRLWWGAISGRGRASLMSIRVACSLAASLAQRRKLRNILDVIMRPMGVLVVW